MMKYKWNRFKFFNKSVVSGDGVGAASSDAEPAGAILTRIDVECHTAGRGRLIFGDREGSIYLIDRSLNATSHKIHGVFVSHLCMLRTRNVLVSVGRDEGSDVVVKILSLDPLARGGEPSCLKAFKLPADRSTGAVAPVTCIAVLESLSQIAIGLANGCVYLIRGSDVSRDRSPKTKIIVPPAIDDRATTFSPITGLGWRNLAPGKDLLFVVTLDSVCTYAAYAKDDIWLELGAGCELGRTVMSDNQSMVLGREQALFFYEEDAQGACLVFEVDGEKTLLFWFRTYLGVVYQSSRRQMATIEIYDVKNKLVACSESFKEATVTHVVSEWGVIFVFMREKDNARTVVQFAELDTQSKLEMLFKKHDYQRAVDLAHRQQLDGQAIAEIYQAYGDHLYRDKRDFESAMDHYIKTIGFLEPSYVIRRYLDADRINALTLYLQALHEKGLASQDHTTLLLNCYTKLKDVEKLDAFIQGSSFDVPAAISVCRQAGYSQHALALARRFNEHDAFLVIQLEDVGARDESGCVKALEYIDSMAPDDARRQIRKYGKALLEREPQRTTELLMKLISLRGPAGGPPMMRNVFDDDDLGAAAAGDADDAPAPSERASLFALSPTRAGPRRGSQASKRSGASSGAGGASLGGTGPYVASPDEFLHVFVNAPHWLTVFLEYAYRQRISCSPLVCDSLVELYLTDPPESVGSPEDPPGAAAARRDAAETERGLRWDKALELFRDPSAQYDVRNALFVCQQRGFKAGTIVLLERLRLFDEIVEFHMESGAYEAVVRACALYGGLSPGLWLKALSYFSSREDAGPQLAEVIDAIDRGRLYPALQVVQMLATNKDAPLSVVKGFLQKQLREEEAVIEREQKAVTALSEETQRMRDEIDVIQTRAVLFQNSNCTLCNRALDLPAVHFFCTHSFHLNCLNDEEYCLKCRETNMQVFGVVSALERTAGDHEKFFKQVEGDPDGFGVIASYFARGLFTKAAIEAAARADRGAGPSGNEREALFR